MNDFITYTLSHAANTDSAINDINRALRKQQMTAAKNGFWVSAAVLGLLYLNHKRRNLERKVDKLEAELLLVKTGANET